MTRRNRFIATVGAAALVVGLGLGAVAVLRPATIGGASEGTASIGGPFRLTSDENRPVTDADLRGKPTVMFFGFTFCPEVCPTTLGELSVLLQKLGPDADRLNVAFVTVDPERDRPEKLHEYLGSFDPRIRGLTGTPAEIDAVAKSYAVYYKKVPLENGDYTMDHTASVYLMDAKGNFVGTISYREDEATAFAKLKRLADGGAA